MEFKHIRVVRDRERPDNKTDIVSFYYVVAGIWLAGCKIKCILRQLIQPKQIMQKEIAAG